MTAQHGLPPAPDELSESGFEALDEQEKIQRYTQLARKALLMWGMADAEVNLIKHRENAVFAVVGPDGTRYALRIHRAGYHSDAALRSELQWMKDLSEFGVHTPAVIATPDGALFKHISFAGVPQERQIDLLSWVPGVAIGSVEQGVEDVAAAARNYKVVGQIVARMHAFARQWQLPPGFTRHAFDEDGLIGEDPAWGRFWELAGLDDEQRQKLHTVRRMARAELSAYGKGADRYGLIHADPLPENFLVEPDGTVNVIDFDDAGFGWLMFEFATAMFFHLGQDYFDELLQAMVTGYLEVRELPPEFEERLPLFLLLRGVTYLGWAHTRRETAIAQQMTPAVLAGVMALVDDYLQQNAGN